MIGREKCAERARIFIAYPRKIVNTILIYDKTSGIFSRFLPISPVFSNGNFYFSPGGDLYMQKILGQVRRCVEDYHA